MLPDPGWTLLDRVIPDDVVAGLNAAWDEELRPFTGPLRRQLTSDDGPHRLVDGRVVNPVLVSALGVEDFPRTAAAFQRLLADTPLVGLAADALGGDVALLQITWVESTEGTAWHRDIHPIAPGEPLIGAWVALEDIHPDAGPFRLLPGSQRETPIPGWDAEAKAAWVAQFVDRSDPRGEAGARLAARLDAAIASSGEAVTEITPRRGDVVLWDGALLHGSRPPTAGTTRTRRSALLHFVARRFAS